MLVGPLLLAKRGRTPVRSPLEGVRVLDLSQGAAGPIAAMVLGDYGADVIKVDPPGGEWGRKLGPPFIKDQAAAYLGMNRNKRSIVVDLKRSEGRDVLSRLAQVCDVIIESFRPGVLDRLGLSYQALALDRPEIIWCSISAFGQDGPWRDKPGVDGIVQAISGIMSVTGEPDGAPVKVGVPAADTVGALIGVQGILLALLARQSSGLGQRVDVSLLDSMLMFQTVPLSMFQASGQSPGRQGSAAPYAAPNEAFPTKDGHIMVAAYWPERWRKFTEVISHPELGDDSRFSDIDRRVANRKELYDELSGIFKQASTKEWIKKLEGADVVCAKIYDYQALAGEDHLNTAERFPSVYHPTLGKIPAVGMPARLSSTPPRPQRPAPLPGEDTTEILTELAGVPADLVERWLSQGVIGQLEKAGGQKGPNHGGV
ncbi:MAG: CoA transferase [Actinomycetota bacterium]|nr:MAG: CoA transferase [Actinomycetota bacterium]